MSAEREPSVRVGDLIAGSRWQPGADYSADRAVAVSLLLPTFRRARDGQFERAVRSVLAQTCRDIELIVVDDASTDGTADIIRRLMAEDGRISCIWHAENIGLPAISEYEAYRRSRGRYIAFAFDDFEFNPDAIEKLLAAAAAFPDHTVHGRAVMVTPENARVVLACERGEHEQLLFTNQVANASILVRRETVEALGFYNPHVAGSRLCDWDLWQRLLRAGFLTEIAADIGTEYGASVSDSLGNTHPVNLGIVSELYNSATPGELRPGGFEAFDVWRLPAGASPLLATAVFEARRFYASKSWARGLPVASADELAGLLSPRAARIGLLVARMDAATMAFFGHYLSRHPGRTQVIGKEIVGDVAHLAASLRGCDAFIVACPLDADILKLAAHARALGVVLYHFVDAAGPPAAWARYRAADLKEALGSFRAILVGSQALRDRFQADALHSDIRILSPAWDEGIPARLRTLAREDHAALRIGLAGGRCRQADFADTVLPAIARVARERPVKLFLPDHMPPPPRFPGPVVRLPWPETYVEMLHAWFPRRLDILVRPRAGAAGAGADGARILLTAAYLETSLVVADGEEPDGAGAAEGVLAAGDAEGWYRALRGLAEGSAARLAAGQLAEAARRRFDPAAAGRELERLAAEVRPRDVIDLVRDAVAVLEAGGARRRRLRVRRPLHQKLLREVARLGKRYMERTE